MMIQRLNRYAAYGVLILAVLLCAQWPLRDGVQAYNRLANDAGQAVFALYMAVALTAASLGSTHLAAHTARPLKPIAYLWFYCGCILPWSVYVFWASLKPSWQALRALERFPESFSPGYFLIHLAVTLLAALALWFSAAPINAWLREKPRGSE